LHFPSERPLLGDQFLLTMGPKDLLLKTRSFLIGRFRSDQGRRHFTTAGAVI
jgi:hypothetical protein